MKDRVTIRGTHPRRPKPADWLTPTLQNVPLLTVLASALGLLCLVAYAMSNGFLPYLLGHVSTLQFVVASIVIGAVLGIGLLLGCSALFWLWMLGRAVRAPERTLRSERCYALVRTALLLLEAVVIVCWLIVAAVMIWEKIDTSRQIMGVHVLVWGAFAAFALAGGIIAQTVWRADDPSLRTTIRLTPRERAVLSFLSFMCMFGLFSFYIVLSLTKSGGHEALWLAGYFLGAAVIFLALNDIRLLGPRPDWKRIAWSLPLAFAVPTTFPYVRPALLDEFMIVLGFRSSANEVVLIDAAAYRDIQAPAAFGATRLNGCAMTAAGRTMWRIPGTVIVWRGPGDRVLVDPDGSTATPVFLRPEQVETLPAGKAAGCLSQRLEPQAASGCRALALRCAATLQG